MKTLKAEGWPALTYEELDALHIVGRLKKGQAKKLLPQIFADGLDCQYLSEAQAMLGAPNFSSLEILIAQQKASENLLFVVRYGDRVAIIAPNRQVKSRIGVE